MGGHMERHMGTHGFFTATSLFFPLKETATHLQQLHHQRPPGFQHPVVRGAQNPVQLALALPIACNGEGGEREAQQSGLRA